MTAQERDWLTYAGISVVALAAAVMSFAAWSNLGELVGITQSFRGWRLSWLLPLSVDVYAVVTARVWLRSTTATTATRDYAKKSSIGAIAMSLGGNALYHLITAMHLGTWEWWPLIVVAVSGIPALQLGLALHLAALVARDRAPVPPGVAGSVTGAASPVAVTEPAREALPALPDPDQIWAELDALEAPPEAPAPRFRKTTQKRQTRKRGSTTAEAPAPASEKRFTTDTEAAAALLQKHPGVNPSKREAQALLKVHFNRVAAIFELADQKRAEKRTTTASVLETTPS